MLIFLQFDIYMLIWRDLVNVAHMLRCLKCYYVFCEHYVGFCWLMLCMSWKVWLLVENMKELHPLLQFNCFIFLAYISIVLDKFELTIWC
jgi:hypothetical protein